MELLSFEATTEMIMIGIRQSTTHTPMLPFIFMNSLNCFKNGFLDSSWSTIVKCLFIYLFPFIVLVVFDSILWVT